MSFIYYQFIFPADSQFDRAHHWTFPAELNRFSSMASLCIPDVQLSASFHMRLAYSERCNLNLDTRVDLIAGPRIVLHNTPLLPTAVWGLVQAVAPSVLDS